MKKIKIIIVITLAGFIFSLGLFVGDNLEIRRLEKHLEYSDTVKTTVAVVNLDTGTTNDDEKVNYASAIIDTLDSGYVLVSSQASKAGFESGLYGAILTFPADFSDKVLSINDLSPEKTQIKFVVNENLPEDKYISTYSELLDLEQRISQSISYMYISSIYTELHIAQNEVDKIFQNDSDDMIALQNVKLADYREQLNLGGIPDVTLNVGSVNLSPYVSKMNSIATNIATIYRDDYALAQTEYGAMHTELSSKMTDIEGCISTVNTSVTDWNQYNNQFLENLNAYTQAVETWNNSFLLWKNQSENLANQAAAYISDVNSWGNQVNSWYSDMSSWESSLLTYSGSVDSYKTALDTYSDSILTYGNNYIAALNTWKSDADAAIATIGPWVSDVEAYGNAITSEQAGYLDTINTYNSNINHLAQYYQDLNTWYNELYNYSQGSMTGSVPQFSTSASLPGSISTASLQPSGLQCPTLPTAWSGLPTPSAVVPIEPTKPVFLGGSLPAAPGNMPTYSGSISPNFNISACPTLNYTDPSGQPLDMIDIPSNLVTLLNEYTSIAASYNPNGYLDASLQSDVDAQLDEYSSLLGVVDRKFEEKQVENINELSAAKDSYESYLMGLRISINNVHNTEQDNLAEAVGAFTEVKTTNSTENKDLLESFANKMPNSMINSVINKDLVEFTVSPIQSINLNLRTSQNINDQSRQRQLNIIKWIVLSFLIAIVMLFMILLIKYIVEKSNATE